MPDFPTLAALWHPALVRYCYRVLGSWEDAEDATSETLINAWRAWERQTFAADADAVRWLYRIARNVCLDAVRRRKRITFLPLIDCHVSAGTVEGEVLWLLRCEEAARLVGALSAVNRAAVVNAIDGLTERESAAMMGTQKRTVGSRLFRARAAMRRELGEVA